MTGRELIIYILQNNLEDEVVIDTESAEEVALHYGVGVSTVKAWYELGQINGIKVNDTLYLFRTPRIPFNKN